MEKVTCTRLGDGFDVQYKAERDRRASLVQGLTKNGIFFKHLQVIKAMSPRQQILKRSQDVFAGMGVVVV